MRQASEFPRDKCSIVSKSRQHAPRMQEREWIYVAPLAVCASKWSFRRSYLRCNKPERSLVRTREDRWCVQLRGKRSFTVKCIWLYDGPWRKSRRKWEQVKTVNRERKSWQAAVNFFPSFQSVALSLHLSTRSNPTYHGIMIQPGGWWLRQERQRDLILNS